MHRTWPVLRTQHLTPHRSTTQTRQVSALSSVNASLPCVYRALAGTPACDAHCSYSEAQLFEEGVALVVRPPGARWRAFASLSGGQQALAALALSFALQARLPSPFYFFDEIDACGCKGAWGQRSACHQAATWRQAGVSGSVGLAALLLGGA